MMLIQLIIRLVTSAILLFYVYQGSRLALTVLLGLMTFANEVAAALSRWHRERLNALEHKR